MAARDKLQDLKNLVKIIEWYEIEFKRAPPIWLAERESK